MNKLSHTDPIFYLAPPKGMARSPIFLPFDQFILWLRDYYGYVREVPVDWDEFHKRMKAKNSEDNERARWRRIERYRKGVRK